MAPFRAPDTTCAPRGFGGPQGPSAHHFLTAKFAKSFLVYAGAWWLWRGTSQSWGSRGRGCCRRAGATGRLGGGDTARQGSWPGMVLVFTFFVLVRTCGRTNVRRNQGVMLKGNSLDKTNPHNSAHQTSFSRILSGGELVCGTCSSPGMTLHPSFLMGAAEARLGPRGPQGRDLTLTLPDSAPQFLDGSSCGAAGTSRPAGPTTLP